MLKSTSPLSHLISRTTHIALPQMIGMGLSFGLSIALAHWLSTEEYGAYTYVLSWVGVLATLGMFGLDRLTVRDVSVHFTQRSWGLLRGSLRWANGVTALVSVLVIGLAGGLQALFAYPVHPAIVLAAGLSIPLVAFIRVQQSTLRGLGHPAMSQIPEPILRPLLMFGFVAALRGTRNEALTVPAALAAYAAATGAALAFGAGLVNRTLPPEAKAASPRYHHRPWFTGAFHMLLLTGLGIVSGQIDMLALGLFKSPEIVATYSAALRGSSFIPLVLNMTVLAIAPTFASLHAAGERAALQQLATRASRLVVLGGLPIVLGMILLGRWFLLLYGPAFVQGQTALTILSLGQLVNVAAGPVATLLTMTGYEREALGGLGVSAGANLLLSLLLIPRWGMEGAAVAAAIGLIAWNVIMVVLVRKRLMISPTIFGDGGLCAELNLQ